MRALHGLRIGADGTGGGANSGANLEPLSRDTLIAAVGGLPQASTHAAQLALDALSAALRPAQILAWTMPGSHTPRRIACLQPSATVILDAIGELDRVVACTRYCADVVPEVADGSRIILADSWTADTAQIVAAQARSGDCGSSLSGKGGQRNPQGGRAFSWSGSEDAGGYLYRHRNHRRRGGRDGSRRRSDCRHAARHRRSAQPNRRDALDPESGARNGASR